MGFAAVILAAGKGTRMKSDLPKVLHPVHGQPMVAHVVRMVTAAGAERVIAVVGYQHERVRTALVNTDAEFAMQEEQLGTGHAVQQAEVLLGDFDGTVVVLNGDVPCLRVETLQAFLEFHAKEGAAATVMTADMDDATGYGRIVRADDDSLLRIVEHKDASDVEKQISEINSGLFCFDCKSLFAALNNLDSDNAQNEFYVTDAIELIREAGKPVRAWCVPDNREVAGVNTVEELEQVESYMEDLGR